MCHRLMTLAALYLVLAVIAPAAAQSVTRSTYKVVNEVQLLMEQERYREALAQLEVLVEQTRDIPYDHAIANQYLAHNSVLLDNVPRARQALQAALATPDLPPQMATELRLFYGSVLLGEEEFALASQMLEQWLAVADAPKPKQLFTVAYANYMNGALPRAEELAARAVNEGGAQAPDSWFHVYYRILFDLRKFRQGETLLYRLLERDPSKALHWRMLASHHLQLDQSSGALAAMMVSYLNGQVGDPDELQQIVSLYSFVDVPEKAARLLDAWIADGRVPAGAETARQLGNLWLMARERDKAKVALTEAARLAPDGNTYAMLGGIYFEDEDWRAAHDAYRRALTLGGVDDAPRIHLLAGISAYRADLPDEARVALKTAAKSQAFRAQARALLKQLNE